MQDGPLLPLPHEVLLNIFEWLSLPDQLAVAKTCHYFHGLMQDRFIWKNKIDALKTFFPPQTVTCLPTQPNFMAISRHLRQRFRQEIIFLDGAFPQMAARMPDNLEQWLALKGQLDALKTLNQDITQDNYFQKYQEINRLLDEVNTRIIDWQLPVAPGPHSTMLKLETITRLPAAILTDQAALFAALKQLELKDNLLERLPENIDICHKLESLNLYDNPISHIPNALGRLQELKFLYLSGGTLTKMPPAIYSLKNLQWLAFDQMELKYIAEEISQLRNLTWLYMRNNKLTFLPLGFSKLAKLKFLMLDNNELYPLQHPEIMRFLTKLDIDLQNNKKKKSLTSSGEVDVLSNQVQFLTLAPQFTASRYLHYSVHKAKPSKKTGLTRNASFF